MRATLYMQDRRNIITGVQVREAEEVRDGSTNWAKHFFKQFHHELELAKNTKKSKLGSHIRIIFLGLERMRKRAAEEHVDAPLGFTMMIATKATPVDGVKPPPMANTPTMRGVVKPPRDAKDKPTGKIKTLLKPKPNPKPKTDQPGIAKTKSTQVDEPEDQMPPTNEVAIPPSSGQPPVIIEAATPP
ncbi:unnamed protein product [Calypogeia fissa]